MILFLFSKHGMESENLHNELVHLLWHLISAESNGIFAKRCKSQRRVGGKKDMLLGVFHCFFPVGLDSRVDEYTLFFRKDLNLYQWNIGIHSMSVLSFCSSNFDLIIVLFLYMPFCFFVINLLQWLICLLAVWIIACLLFELLMHCLLWRRGNPGSFFLFFFIHLGWLSWE